MFVMLLLYNLLSNDEREPEENNDSLQSLPADLHCVPMLGFTHMVVSVLIFIALQIKSA